MPLMSAPLHVGVVGAGIIGASVAWALTRAGARVTVFEREGAPATGSTGRSAAGLRHQFSLRANVRLSRYGAERYAAFEREVGSDAGFRRVGYLFLVPPDGAKRWARDRAMQREEGADVERWSLEDLAERAPYVERTGLAEGSFGAGDGVLDPHAATLGYLAGARAAGATVLLDAPVQALNATGDGWRVRTPHGAHRVDRLVNAAGPQAGAVAALAGAHLPVHASRRDVFVTTPVPGLRTPTPLVVDVATGVWWRSEGERVILGRSNPAEPPGERTGVDWPYLETVLALALPRFPFLERVALDRRASWWGWYEVTPDHLPAIGPASDAPGLWHAAGFSGHGVQHAPATGAIVAAGLTSGGDAGFDLAPFRPDRFTDAADAASAHPDGEERVV
jgi:sarcosine oxidase subunit beta